MRKTQNQLFLLSFLLSSFVAHPVLAENRREIPKAPSAPEPVSVVVTASRMEQRLKEISSATTVITRKDIERQKAQTVIEALRNVPGLHFTKSGGPGRLATVFLRGASSNQTLVLMDGVQINSPTTGDFDFGNLTTENVERIEVIRGPQSPLYGSDAMGGVINIITRKATPKPELDSWFEFGTDRTFYEGQTFSGSWRDMSLFSSWSRLDTDGVGDNDQFEDTNVTTHFDTKLGEKASAEFLYRYAHGLVGIDDGAFRPDPNRSSRSRHNIVGTTLRHEVTEGWHQTLKGSFFHDRLFSFDPRDPGTTQAESRFKLDTDVYTLDWQHDLALGDHDTLTFGYEFEHARSNNKSFDSIIRNHGWYMQNLLEVRDSLFLTAGVRFDEHQTFGFDVNPKFGIAYLIHQTDTKLRANVGTAFRAPTLNQLFFPNFGNPNLQPEESIGFDFGMDQSLFSDRIFTGATYFYNYFEELIQAVTQGGVTIAQNVGKSRTRGFELEGGVRLFKGCEAKIFYTFLVAETIARREPLIRRPKHSGGVDFNWRLFDRLTWNVNLTVTDERYDSSFAAGRPTREIVPNFSKLDTTLTFDIHKRVQLYARVENLTDDDDDEIIGFDAPGTQFFGGVKIKLG